MKSLETRIDQGNAILGQNFSIFGKMEKFVSIFHTGAKVFHLREAGKICGDIIYWGNFSVSGKNYKTQNLLKWASWMYKFQC
jgi:hypothetical protein